MVCYDILTAFYDYNAHCTKKTYAKSPHEHNYISKAKRGNKHYTIQCKNNRPRSLTLNWFPAVGGLFLEALAGHPARQDTKRQEKRDVPRK